MNASSPDTPVTSFDGLTLLVVEDETIVSFLLEDMLIELGCSRVLHAGRVQEALALLREHKPDAVVLDVNLAGEYAYPVAERLVEAQVPFVFTTGYGRSGIPADWASQPVIQKPFSMAALAAALQMAMSKPPPAP